MSTGLYCLDISNFSSSHRQAINQLRQLWLRICEWNEPEKFIYRHMEPILQEGPTCGLVALAMISSLTERPAKVSDLLDICIACGYSRQGEMFSASNMYELAENILEKDFSVTLYKGGLLAHKSEVIDELIAGSILLVPYDADKNHHPSHFGGHRAHWAVICGLLANEDKYYLIARQGKSRYVSVWEFEHLITSNQNLNEISPSRMLGESEYVTFDVKETLAGQFLIIRDKFH